jgi:hypothetical protein
MATGNVVGGGMLMAGGNSALTQGFANGFDNISWGDVAMSSMAGGMTSFLGGSLAQGLHGPLSSVFSSISSPMLRDGLTYASNGALTGFTMGTGMGLASGKDFSESFELGGKSAALGFASGFGYGAYNGYQSARTSGLNPLTGRPELREKYIQEVKALKLVDAEMKAKGFSEEQRAIELHRMRRNLGIEYKNRTPDSKLNEIYQRNLMKYGDKYGPSIDFLREQNKTWSDIIKGAYTPGGKDLNF